MTFRYEQIIVNPANYSNCFAVRRSDRLATIWLDSIRDHQNAIARLSVEKSLLPPNNHREEKLTIQINEHTKSRDSLLAELTGSFKDDVEKELELRKNQNIYVFSNKDTHEKDLKAELFQACKLGELDKVKYLLEEKQLNPFLLIHHLESDETGPLFKFATASGNLDLVKYLVKKWKVDIDSVGTDKNSITTPLSEAVKKGYHDIVNYLLKQEANPNYPISERLTILGNAIYLKNTEIIKELLSAKSKVTVDEINLALESGNLDIVKLMNKYCPDFKKLLPTRQSNTYIHSAVKSGNIEVVEYLIHEQNLSILSFSPFQSSDINDQNRITDLFRAAAQSSNSNMLRYLTQTHHFDLIESIKKEREQTNDYAWGISHTILGAFEVFYNIDLLIYLFEEQKLVLDEKTFEKFKEDAKYEGIRIKAYLESFVPHSDEDQQLLRLIGKQGLTALDTPSLFKLYHSDLLTSCFHDFPAEIAAEIEKRGITNQQIELFHNQFPSFSKNAFFFYATCDVINGIEKLKYLVEMLKIDINTQNADGETAAKFIAEREGYNNQRLQYLISQNANLDLPDQKGKTVITILLSKAVLSDSIEDLLVNVSKPIFEKMQNFLLDPRFMEIYGLSLEESRTILKKAKEKRPHEQTSYFGLMQNFLFNIPNKVTTTLQEHSFTLPTKHN